MGTYAWNILYSKILPAKSRARHRRPATKALPSQAVHRNLATGPKWLYDCYFPQRILSLGKFKYVSWNLAWRPMETIVFFSLCKFLCVIFQDARPVLQHRAKARDNTQFEKVKKEIINRKKKRDSVQNHTFYAKKRYFLQKVRNAVQKSI